MAKMVEIASFADRQDAELAAYFLQRHGLNAFAGSGYHGENAATSVHRSGHDCAVLVSEDGYDEARDLFARVLKGEFSDADPDQDSRRGLGAALAQAVAPTPGYKTPPQWMLWVPFLLISLLFSGA